VASDTPASVAAVHRFILLTDIVQSSRLAELFGREYLAALALHNRLVERSVAAHGGLVYKQTGDGYLALFETAGTCLDAALELGGAFARLEPVAENEPLLVRLVLHAGELQPSGAEYFGPALNRVSRICQVCNPGQVLASAAVVSTLSKPPAGVTLADLGQHHLRDLAEPEQLYQVDSEHFACHDFPPLSTLGNRPNNLVRQPNQFIGRQQELKALALQMLDGTCLLTIVAPGGYGKSRLAAQLCANLLHRFEHGVFMAYLAPVRESVDVPLAIANALGYQFSAGRMPEQQLCDYLRSKDLLLCLDNFEHLLDSAALLTELLQAAPKLKIVVTSREPLRIEGESIYRLEPLGVESGTGEPSDAVRLFADRAALVKHGYTLTADGAAAIQRLCEHLSGIPLAIELAAAWMDAFTLEELHDELSSRLELEARTSDKPQRHQSLKACLDWSWELLGAEQQEAVMRLSVFRGGFFSEAAGAILGISGMKLRAALARLADKSWLYTREVDGNTRFFLRDMLAHEYAIARLEDTRGSEDSLFEQVVRAHAEYFVVLAEREGQRLEGGGTADGGVAQMAAVRCWRLELDNILEALDSCLRREEVGWLLPIARYLHLYLDMASSFFALRDRFTLLLEAAQAGGHAELRAQALSGLGLVQWRLGNYGAARELHEQALALCRAMGDRKIEARCLSGLGAVARSKGKYGEARELYEQALALYRDLSDRNGKADCLNSLGVVEYFQGNYSEAVELFEQALALNRERGKRNGEANCLNNLGIVEFNQSNYSAAQALFEQALALHHELGDRDGEATCLNNLANVPRSDGMYSEKQGLYKQALALNRELGDRSGEAINLINLGSVERSQGNYGEALELLGQALALNRELGDRNGEATCLNRLGTVKYLQGNYGEALELLEQALALNRELGDRKSEANCLNNMGIVEYNQSNYSVGRALCEQALALYRELGSRTGESSCLNSLGNVARMQGNYGEALELLEQALELNRELGDRTGEATNLCNLGIVARIQSSYSEALKLFQQALELNRELGRKAEFAANCVEAGAALAGLDHLRPAAVALYGGHHVTAGLEHKLDPGDQQALEQGLARLDAATADGSITAGELAQLKVETEAMSLDELAESLLAELAKRKENLRESEADQRAGM